ncbi:MAG: caspase family protein [bacterium]|nr:caspase family protein [bacterium]
MKKRLPILILVCWNLFISIVLFNTIYNARPRSLSRSMVLSKNKVHMNPAGDTGHGGITGSTAHSHGTWGDNVDGMRLASRPTDEPAHDADITAVNIGKQHLFMIAVDSYLHWPPLGGPVREAESIGQTLVSRYHIDSIKSLYNKHATGKAIRNYLKSLQGGGRNQLTENDSLIIYFGGHGYAFNEEPDNGYWIPHDGGKDKDARAFWIGNAQLTGLVKKIKARHILIISDACFAGTLVDSKRGSRDWNIEKNYLWEIYGRKSRKVLTSGGLERVPGRSQLARYLNFELMVNQKSWISMAEIYNSIAQKVYAETGNFPAYGNLRHSNFDPSASFLLFTREGRKHVTENKRKKASFGFNFKLQVPPAGIDINLRFRRLD